jgi:hypothetical protein
VAATVRPLSDYLFVHKSLINFKQGKWIEYINNLAPGVYVIDEYHEMVVGRLLPRPLTPSKPCDTY